MKVSSNLLFCEGPGGGRTRCPVSLLRTGVRLVLRRLQAPAKAAGAEAVATLNTF